MGVLSVMGAVLGNGSEAQRSVRRCGWRIDTSSGVDPSANRFFWNDDERAVNLAGHGDKDQASGVQVGLPPEISRESYLPVDSDLEGTAQIMHAIRVQSLVDLLDIVDRLGRAPLVHKPLNERRKLLAS